MFELAAAAKEEGMGTLFHPNGRISEEPLAALLDLMDAATVDLRSHARVPSASQLLDLQRGPG